MHQLPPSVFSHPATRASAWSVGPALPVGAFVPPAPVRRDRLWDLSANLHCSIIGTCLSTADLRALLDKLGDPSARGASEHDLHGQAVGRAARKEGGGKLLHKLLDRRHAREIARFARADGVEAVRALWKEAVRQGKIPGAYWAVLTHPASDRALVNEAFGEVHMLSHLVGRSVRADLRRLAELEAEAVAQADRIAEQEARIRSLTDEKVALGRRLDERAIGQAASPPAATAGEQAELVASRDREVARLSEQLRRAEAHAGAEAGRRREAERALRALAEDVRLGSEREAALRSEVSGLEALLADHLPDEIEARTSLDGSALDGLTLVYVGGRPRQVAQARLLVGRMGGRLLTHDGGVEDNSALLAGLVARADAVLFPVDCVSHDAVGWLKRTCRERAIQLLPLRTASLAAIVAAVTSLRPRA